MDFFGLDITNVKYYSKKNNDEDNHSYHANNFYNHIAIVHHLTKKIKNTLNNNKYYCHNYYKHN